MSMSHNVSACHQNLLLKNVETRRKGAISSVLIGSRRRPVVNENNESDEAENENGSAYLAVKKYGLKSKASKSFVITKIFRIKRVTAKLRKMIYVNCLLVSVSCQTKRNAIIF